jgi:hypothetical protein
MKSVAQRKQELIGKTKDLQMELVEFGLLRWSMDRQLELYQCIGGGRKVLPDRFNTVPQQ